MLGDLLKDGVARKEQTAAIHGALRYMRVRRGNAQALGFQRAPQAAHGNPVRKRRLMDHQLPKQNDDGRLVARRLRSTQQFSNDQGWNNRDALC